MKSPARSTYLLITATRIARMDFHEGTPMIKTGPRPLDVSSADAVRAALALGAKPGHVWLLSEDVHEQKIRLKTAQIAGLNAEQLARALSFEAEPFSGIPVAEGAIGFHALGDGAYDVVEMYRADRDAILRVVTGAGGKLAGIAHPGLVPDETQWEEWLPRWSQRLQAGGMPLITPPPPVPSANRFYVVGGIVEGVALLLVLLCAAWTTWERKTWQAKYAEFTAAANQLDAATKRIATLKKELASLDKEQDQRESIIARRGSLLALLNALSASCGDDVVIQAIEPDGTSNHIVSGMSIEASAVDELSIVLTQSLRSIGWNAQPRSKTGKHTLMNGGPWEFSLTISNEDAERAKAMQLTMKKAQ